MKSCSRLLRIAATVSAALAFSSLLSANTVWVEAEGIRAYFRGGDLTSPLLVRDDPAASGGSYVVATGGPDTNAAPHATDGHASLSFSVANAGTYRIWARVIALSTAADSFWLKMDGGAWLKWNGMEPGSGWHWVQVKAEGAAGAAPFNLSEGEHTLTAAYREKNTRLDVFIVTDDPAFDPRRPLSGPPADISVLYAHGGGNAVKVVWNTVPGATSYSVYRLNFPTWQVVSTGIAGHTYTDLMPGDASSYLVVAHAPTGSSNPVEHSTGSPSNGLRLNWRGLPDSLSVTPPMRFTEFGDIEVPAGSNSLAAPPARGRARLDFVTPVAIRMKVWARTAHPSTSSDSFWVKVDAGSWIKWNGIKDFCDDVHDSDNGGRPVIFSLAAGSHTLEFAHREAGAGLNGILTLVEDISNPEPCSD